MRSSTSSSSSSSNGNTIQLPYAARAVYLFCCLLALNNAYITFSRHADPYHTVADSNHHVHEPARALQATAAAHHAQRLSARPKQPNDQAKTAFIAGDSAVAAAAAAAVQQTVESDERIQLSMHRRHQGHQLQHQENPTSSLETTAARATAKQTKRKRSSDRVSSTNNSNTTTESKTTQLWHHNHNQANKPENNGLATNTAAATESSSSSSSTAEGGNSVKLSSPFIHYTLHPIPTFHKRQSLHNPHAFLNKFNVYYQCDSAKRKPLPRQVQTVLDYTTTLSTNLKLLVMGDSVAIQWSQALDEALGATMLDETDTAQSANATLVAAVSTRQVVLRRRRRHEDLTVAGPLRRGGGRGLVAAWRITGLWTRRREHKPLPHEPGGGWTRRDLTALVASPRYQAVTVNNATATPPLPQPQRQMAPNTDPPPPPPPPLFDSLIFRIPHGWITLAQVTREDVLETIALAHELLGVRTVVFVSMPFINNVQTLQDVADLERTNANLRTWVDEYNANRTLAAAGGAGGVERVMILEFGHLMDELMALNARLMGYDTTDSQYIMDRLDNVWNNSIPFVCGERVKAVTTVDATTQKTKVVRPTTCATNRLTYDGIHWCMESISGRVLAGLACLLGCFHNRNDTAVANNGNVVGPDETKVAAMQQCEQGCNIEFMSLERMRKDARKLPYTQH
jgi:hypothetical protein